MAGVFVFKDAKTLVPMQPVEFEGEADFQQLLADFPDLLSGDQINPASPRRWILVSREKGIATEEGGTARFSLDHLFIDQDGVPTFVEVKRQGDTRLRREVVAQMLDYAANAVRYWPIEELQAQYSARTPDPEEALRHRLNFEGDLESFWKKVKQNLLEGKIRLLFVADQIPSELRRIVEFLNEQMDRTEVLALELRQYQGEGMKTLVPIIYGQTEEAQQKKGIDRGRQWIEQDVYDAIQSRFGAEAMAVAQKVGSWMRKQNADVSCGYGTNSASIRAGFMYDGRKFNPLKVWSYGSIEIGFQTMSNSPFRDEGKRRELLRRLNEIEGVNLADNSIGKYTTISLKLLSEPAQLSRFFDAMNWFVAELHEPSPKVSPGGATR
jgi:hypothetical protein